MQCTSFSAPVAADYSHMEVVPTESVLRVTGCVAADINIWPAFVCMCIGEIGECILNSLRGTFVL